MYLYKETDSDKNASIVFASFRSNTKVLDLLEYLNKGSDEEFWLSGSGLIGTVWNYQDKLEMFHGIKDLDIIYYSDSTSPQHERDLEELINVKFNLGIPIEVRNQSLMHLWRQCKPYLSLDDALESYYSQLVCNAITLRDGILICKSVYSLQQIIDRVMLPNIVSRKISDEFFQVKLKKYQTNWQGVTTEMK